MKVRQLDYTAFRAGYEAEMRRYGGADGDWDLEDGLLEIHRFVDRLRNTSSLPYVRKNGTRPWEPSGRFPEVGRIGLGPSQEFLSRFDVSPQIRAFAQVCAMHRLPDLFWITPNEPARRRRVDTMTCAEVFNMVVEAIRKRGTQPGFQQRFFDRRATVLTDCERVVELVRQFSGRTRHPSVSRIELLYSEIDRTQWSPRQVKADLKQLLNNWRKHKVHRAVEGYFWKLQYGTRSGYHVHLVALLNANKLPDSIDTQAELDLLWKSAAGVHARTRVPREDCPILGAGAGLWTDKRSARTELLRGLQYLLQKDQYFRIRTAPRQRTYGRSELRH